MPFEAFLAIHLRVEKLSRRFSKSGCKTGKTLAGAFLGRHLKSFLVGQDTPQAAQSFLLTNRPTKENDLALKQAAFFLCKVEHASCMLNQTAMASALGPMLRLRRIVGQALCHTEKRKRLGSTLKKGNGEKGH